MINRHPDLMSAKETELDYLCRLTVDSKSTFRSLEDITQTLVNFIKDYDIDLVGQLGIKYTNFREYGFEKPIFGGFGSRKLLGKILINNEFDIDNYSKNIKNKILSLYDKINFEIQISDAFFTFSLHQNYKKLEDIEYLEFVYNFSMMNRYDKSSCYYPDCRLVIKQYLDDVEPIFNVIDGETISSYMGDLIVSASSKFNNLEDIENAFIIHYKDIFCKKHDLDPSLSDDDFCMLVQVIEC